jgi:hypothetical protein
LAVADCDVQRLQQLQEFGVAIFLQMLLKSRARMYLSLQQLGQQYSRHQQTLLPAEEQTAAVLNSGVHVRAVASALHCTCVDTTWQ